MIQNVLLDKIYIYIWISNSKFLFITLLVIRCHQKNGIDTILLVELHAAAIP